MNRLNKAPGKKKNELPEPNSATLTNIFTITSAGLRSLIEGLMHEMDVIGVKSKQDKFAYGKLSSFSEFYPNHDVTILPPTNYLLPVNETLMKFKTGSGAQFESVLETRRRAIVGIHPYDINAIKLLDEIFMTKNPDPNYIARRNNTLIIGFDCTYPSGKAFAPSMGTWLAESGFDLLLTDIGNRYVVTVGSQNGTELLHKYAKPKPARSEEIANQKEVRGKALSQYQVSLNVPIRRLLEILECNYDNPYWESRSKNCLSCDSCIMVCPTCYCFDIKDEMELDLTEGKRIRHRDGCMLVDFARTATGENFRPDKASRFRHRIFHKVKYLTEKYGMPGCVGCGRCATACLAEIASPAEALNTIAELRQNNEKVVSIQVKTRVHTGLYLPRPARIMKIKEVGVKEKVFDFTFTDGTPLNHRPGQFVEISIAGIGEISASVSSSPTHGGVFQLALRSIESVTKAIYDLKEGDIVGIRGPYGNGFPLEFLRYKDILFLYADSGLFLLRSLIQYIIDKKGSFDKVIILSGARSPADKMFIDDEAEWSKTPGVEFLEMVETSDETWQHGVGIVTSLIQKVKIDAKKTVAVIGGPSILYRFAAIELKKANLADDNIFLSLERKIKCGIGKCGHCQINNVHVCQEGPVFSLAQLRNLREAIY